MSYIIKDLLKWEVLAEVETLREARNVADKNMGSVIINSKTGRCVKDRSMIFMRKVNKTLMKKKIEKIQTQKIY